MEGPAAARGQVRCGERRAKPIRSDPDGQCVGPWTLPPHRGDGGSSHTTQDNRQHHILLKPLASRRSPPHRYSSTSTKPPGPFRKNVVGSTSTPKPYPQ